MAISDPISRANSGSGTNGSSFLTALFTPNAGAVIVAMVSSGLSATDANGPSGLSGHGTWTKQAGLASPNSNIYLSLWWTVASGSPSNDRVTISFPSSRDNCLWNVFEMPGVDPATPFVQSKIATSLSSGSISITLDSAITAGNALLEEIIYNAGSAQTITLDANMTAIGSRQSVTSPTNQLWGAYELAPADATAAFSTSNASGKVILAAEFKQLVSASGPTSGMGFAA